MMARWRQRVRLQDGLRLDLNALVRQELVHPGSKRNGTIRWAYRDSSNEMRRDGLRRTRPMSVAEGFG